MLGDDPPYLSVGTEVSAKYKGAFCEAKIRKVVRSVKCRVTYKAGLGTATVTDEQIKGTLRVGASVEARPNDKKEFFEATITKIQDCSQYTVVFDDGDITTLRRTALCLKSGRHFAESETLDQLPLTHPEHFGNPVIGGRRGRRSRQTQDDSSDEDDDTPRGSNDSGSASGGKEGPETEPEIGRVVCVELGDKKKKDNWFPGLVVAPSAQDTVRIKIRDDYLVRSFKDARFYTVPKKEATEFTKDLVNKVENSALKVAVEKALLFLEKNELPPHWDRDSLFGNSVSSDNSDSDGELDSDSSDDEPREEKDHFVAQLYKFMDDRGTPINNCPMIGNEDIDLYRLFRAVYKLGGYNRVTNQNQWKSITRRLGFSMQNNASTHNLVKQAYKKFLHSFEDFYRKLGCTMVNHPRGGMRKPRPGRSLIRDKDRNTPIPSQDKSIVKIEKEEEDKKITIPEEEAKKEKREIKKEPVVKEEEPQVKLKRKEEPPDESVSGQDSDVNIDAEEESSSSEKSQKSSSRLTPSSVTSGKSKIMTPGPTKNKEDAAKNKKPVTEKKKPEVKKQEKKEEKSKEEDSTKTRSKSKEDVSKGKPSPETRETRTPSREPEKKIIPKQKKMTEEELKKRGRKKKEAEGEKGKSPDERSVDHAPCYKGPVEIGDRLKVYYGPTHESKVTYEAKVIDMEKDGAEPVYLVHYTGWNTRYDEWIKVSRIAQNFTQGQGRVKRSKATPRPQTPSSTPQGKSSKSLTAPNAGTGAASSAARRRALADTPSTGGSVGPSRDSRKDDREGTPITRSMTPSPLISNSLRTKSPASSISSRTTRVTRNADSASSNDPGTRRSRRGSGHNDQMMLTETEDSDTLSSDGSAGRESTISTKSRQKSTPVLERNRREARRRAESRMKIEETSDGEVEKDTDEPRRGRRLRKPLGKIQDIKSEPDSEEEQPKGRDFDLNQIRSELKGFDKAVKLEIPSVESSRGDSEDQLSSPIKQEKIDPETHTEKKAVPESEKKKETPKPESQNISPLKRDAIKIEASHFDSTEDIYEFKEPEPFEFEVRNKRDSGGSSSSSTDKDKDKEKDKDKLKKRMFEEDLKSPKKRQKTSGTPTKTEAKTESSTTESADSKKKVRKIFKKNEEHEDADAEGEDGPTSSKEFSKFYAANYSNVIIKRKGTGTGEPSTEETSETSNEDKVKKTPDEDKSPKKRQPKTFGTATTAKNADTKAETATESDPKKKARKAFNKKIDDLEEKDESDSDSKELIKFLSNYSGSRAPSRKDAFVKSSVETDDVDENSMSDGKEKVKKLTGDDTTKNVKKRRNVGASLTKTDAPETTDFKKKQAVRRVPSKKLGEADDADNSESDDLGEPPLRDQTKYFSHYSGPKAKAAAALAADSEITQAASKTEAQSSESSKFPPSSKDSSHDKDLKTKVGEPVARASPSVDAKQGSSADKKRITTASPSASKTETKLEPKALDFTPVIPHSLPVPAPISARLPATASIEEKLSAAAVFRSKQKDVKKEEEIEVTTRKIIKDTIKKAETTSVKKTKEKEDTKIKHEPEKKKQHLSEQVIVKKDPLQDVELRKDPLLEVMKKKDDEVLKAKKEPDLKATVSSLASTVTKTYGSQKKDVAVKLEDSWKKNLPSTSISMEQAACELPGNEPVKDFGILRKETIVSKIKSSMERDSIDSTDSSDSERRLTIIDSEDFPEDKCNDSGSDVKSKNSASSVAGQYNYSSQQEHATAVQKELVQHVFGMMQGKNPKTEEDGENLNSLLCEEEIPGSPTPGTESTDHDHRSTSSQNLAKSDMASKMVAFVAAQLPISTVASSTQMTNCAIVDNCSMSSGLNVSASSSSVVMHSSMSARQAAATIHALRHFHQVQPQVQHQAQPQVQAHPQPAVINHHHQAPIRVALARRESNEAAPVMDNTPPTTPDSSISNISGSPRDERAGGSTPSSSEDNSKLNRDSSEAENESCGKSSGPGLSEDDNMSPANTSPSSDRIAKPPAKRGLGSDAESISPMKKRKKRSLDNASASNQSVASGKKSPRQSSSRNARHANGSDSDDTSEGSSNNNNAVQNNPLTSSNTGSSSMALTAGNTDLTNFSSRSPRPTKYNFCNDLDPNLDGNQRITILQQNLSELRKTYNAVKSELAAIERRRKKLKRREREAQKAAKAEMQQACS